MYSAFWQTDLKNNGQFNFSLLASMTTWLGYTQQLGSDLYSDMSGTNLSWDAEYSDWKFRGFTQPF
jgi:hypothetical protein